MKHFAIALTFALLLGPAVQAQEGPEAQPPSQIQSIPTEAVPIETSPRETNTPESQSPQKIMPGSKLYIEPGDFRQVMSAAILKTDIPQVS